MDHRAPSSLIAFLLVSCLQHGPPASRVTSLEYARPRTTAASQTTTVKRAAKAADVGTGHCPFGSPRLQSHVSPYESAVVIKREGYELWHGSVRKSAIYVCERVTAAQLGGNLPRPGSSAFKPDPFLVGGNHPHATLQDYKGSGYDRGHLAPAGDQTVDAQLKVQTFYLSNMAPQVPDFNRQVWGQLEALVRSWVRRHGTVFIITGPIGAGPANAIGPGKVWVPTHFFKIVITKHPDCGWQAIAFVLENRKHPNPYQWATYLKSVDWIESQTKLDFMPGLSAAMEKQLEGNAGKLEQWN